MTAALLRPTRTGLLAALIAVQSLCAAFFLWDALVDYLEGGTEVLGLDLGVETLATLSMIVAIGLEARLLTYLMRREAHMIRSLGVAARALHDIIDEHFAAWRLTPAEQDVATFLIKGADIAEIARLRGSAEGTVKAHLNAIYRKAGVSGRPALISLLVEDLMGEPLLGADRDATLHGGERARRRPG